MNHIKQKEKIKNAILSIKDFPKQGIVFKDITPVLNNNSLFKATVNLLAKTVKKMDFDVIIGPESRGFWFAAPLAIKLKKSFVPVRKKGKLPRKTVGIEYTLEYNKTSLFIHKEDIKPGSKVLLVDDVIATGGTIIACKDLIENQLNAKLVGAVAIADIGFLNGIADIEKSGIVCKTIFSF